jgi:hypothetical protein
MGNKRVSFFAEEALHYKEFKEFCVNFIISGLLINSDQVSYIFRKVSKRNEGEQEEKFFLRYKDFLVAIGYICILAKSERGRKIVPSDLNKVDTHSFKMFYDFLGVKLPFYKKDVEDFINDRRALSAKQFIMLQNKMKKEKASILKGNTSDDAKIESVDVNKLSTEDINVVNPEGNKETWKVNNKK